MNEEKVLFQIKAFDKLILRYLFQYAKTDFKTFSHMPTPTQMQIMEYLLTHLEEEIYQKDLETVLNLRRATISGVLKTMEKHGFIERSVTDKDARTKKIVIPSSMKKIFESNKKYLDNVEDIVTKNISKEELDVFLKVLGIMSHNLEDIFEK